MSNTIKMIGPTLNIRYKKMSMMKEITLSYELPDKGLTLLYLYTSTNIIPNSSMDKILRKNPTIQFVKTNVSVPSEIYDEYSVSRVPAFMFLNNGILQWSYTGTDMKYLATQIKAFSPGAADT